MAKMTTRFILMACAAALALPAGAQQAAVGTPATGNNAAGSAAMPKSGRISPRQRIEMEAAALAERNAKAGADFLAANGAKPGVVTMPSGVQYQVLKAGNGAHAGNTSTISCRYTGKLIDGSTFDKTDDKAPAQLKVSGLVAGLREAVMRMPVGSKWEVVVPPQLGYGVRGSEGVGRNAVLTYVVELIGVQ
jgi:FKBP-type peptidyl-prolyl cis-trans isomerase FklB